MDYYFKTPFKFGTSIIPIDFLPAKKHSTIHLGFLAHRLEADTTYRKVLIVELQSVIYGQSLFAQLINWRYLSWIHSSLISYGQDVCIAAASFSFVRNLLHLT